MTGQQEHTVVSSAEPRYLITKYKIEDGRVRLWPKSMRHPELILFDVSDLQEAGIDWQSAAIGVETPCRFWAYWTPSDKTKSSGNPYKDVTRLEPCDTIAADNTDLDVILGELRAIKALLVTIAGSPIVEPHPDAPIAAATLADLDAALFGEEPSADVRQDQFQAIVTHHLASGTLPADTINTIADRIRDDLNGHGWDLAADCLQIELQRRVDHTEKQIEQRQKVIDRLLELLDHPAVKNGGVQHTLKPGWIWTYAYTDLIRAGKALRADLDATIKS